MRVRENPGSSVASAEPRPTLHDVAQLARVAPITVSRALQRPELVAEGTRLRIASAVEQLGYVPDLVARSFRSSRSGLVAAIVPSLDNSQYAEMLQGVSDELHARGIELMVGVSGYSLDREADMLRAFIGRRPEGILVSGVEHRPAAHEILNRAGIPVVETGTLAGRPIDMNVGYVEEAAAAAMVDHLVAAGYRRIGFVCGPLNDNERAHRRRNGFRAAMRRHGRPTDRIVTLVQPAGVSTGGQGAAELLERWPDTDCLFCSSDAFAIGALFECQRRGWPVPDRLGIAGFLGLPLSGETVPALTTVRVPRYEIGRRAAAMLLARLSGGEPAERTCDLGFEVLPRASTRRPMASIVT
jgi:LacI family gluconate utilization system Gnt-I transcriptional repressor